MSDEELKKIDAQTDKSSPILAIEEIQNFSDEELQEMIVEYEHWYREMIKPYFENSKNLISEIHRRKGLGYKFQDEESGAVLKLVQEEYKSVSLFNLGVHRTRFDDSESRQSLSNKEAEESGFVLKFGDRRKKK